MDAPAIALHDVSKRFGHLTALQGVVLNIPEGTAFALFGPNGAGKSTLLRLVATLGKPTSGQVRIRGIDTRQEPERVRADLGLISHQTLLYEDLTARENLAFYGKMYGLNDLNPRVESTLETVGLLDRQHDRVRGFSRGMKQRLTIARATLHRPAILLLDEPFTGLDAAARTMLSGMLQTLRQEGRTILLVTHDLQQGLALTDRFAILNRGRIVAQNTTEGMTVETLQTLYEKTVSGGVA